MNYLEVAKNVLSLEAQVLLDASKKLNQGQISRFVEIMKLLAKTGGSLVFCGVGKSGTIATKLASTFSSLGLPSFFLHPTDALHGDLGRVTKFDAIVFISKSGNTNEILKLMPFLLQEKDMLIGLIGNLDSPISAKCSIVFDCSVKSEACINNQAPTSSSTLALAMGDALAVVYENLVELSMEGFAVNHPGGLLGKSMLFKVKDLMWPYEKCPRNNIDSNLEDVILSMTSDNIGGCAIVDDNRKLLGIVVEGDIRRTFTRKNEGLKTKVSDFMTKKPISIDPDEKAINAMKLMEERAQKIDILPVVSVDNTFLGFIRIHDLLKEGFGSGL